MKITNEFLLDLPKQEAWRHLLDVALVADALPGAELLEEVDERTFRGRVSVKLGPVALTFEGVAQIDEIDEAAGRVRMTGKGRDKRGRGNGSAVFDIAVSEAGNGRTRVQSQTDVTLTGTIANYGRGTGMIQAVADEIIGRFASNLEAEVRRRSGDPAPSGEPEGEVSRPAAELSVFSMLFGALRRRLGVLFGRGHSEGRSG